MKLKRLSIRNFRSFTTGQVLDIESLDIGLHYVTGVNEVDPDLGSNGSGKSSLFEALIWILFGKISTNHKAGLIANWEGEGPIEGVLVFEKDQELYTLERTWSKGSNKVVLYVQDNLKSEWALRTPLQQERLEQVLGLNFESFLYSVFLSQFTSKFFDLSPAEKLEVFTSILGNIIQRWEDCSAYSRHKADNTDIALNKALQEKDLIEYKIEEVHKSDVEKRSAEWLEKTVTRVKDAQFLIRSKLKDLKQIESDLKEKAKEHESSSKKMKNLSGAKETFKNDLKEIKERRDKIYLKIAGEESLLKSYEDEMRKYTSVFLNGECPYCHQKVTKRHIEEEQDRLKKLIEKHKRSTQVLKLQNVELVNKELDLVQGFDELTSKIESHAKAVRDSEEAQRMLLQEKTQTEAVVEGVRREIGMLKEEKNPFSDLVKANKAQIRLQTRNLIHVEEDIERLKEQYEIYKFWQKGFKDIRLMVIEEAIKELEININNELQTLGMGEWSVELNIDSETKSGTVKRGFTVLVKSPNNQSEEQIPLELWSGGERQRLKMAGTLGLIDFIHSRRGTDLDIEIYDEPTEWLSKEGIEDLLDNLAARARSLEKKIFIIDHRDFMSFGIFESIIKVTKLKGGSVIDQVTEGGAIDDKTLMSQM